MAEKGRGVKAIVYVIASISAPLSLVYVIWKLFGIDIAEFLTHPVTVIYQVIFLMGFFVWEFRRRNQVNEIYVVELIRLLKSMDRTLNGLYQAARPDTMAETIEFYQNKNGSKVKVENMFMKVEAVADLAVAFKDKKGNLAKVDGKPVWALTNDALGALVVSEDGMSASFTAAGDVAAGKIQVKADADLGEGVKEIIGELDVELSPLDAEIVEITATVRP